MKTDDYRLVISKAIEIAKANLSADLSVGEIAKQIGYSPSRLRGIFQQTTGRSLMDHILDLRVEEAKRLLSQTNLKITEVAFETGFGGNEHFTRTFHHRTGLSPSRFRSAHYGMSANTSSDKGAAGERECFRQNFMGEELSGDLDVREGTLTQMDDYIIADGPESFGIYLLRPLPENVEISVEVRILSVANGGPSHAMLMFRDENFNPWYQVTLGEHDLKACILKQLGVDRRVYANPPLRPDEWQTVRLRLTDDHMSVFLDKECLFEFKNAFPPLYSQRCRFALGTYQSQAHFRRFVVKDLGIPPLVRAVRQGDALYNAGSYDAAREFFCRILEAQTNLADSPELDYKIGMCFSSQGALSQSRTWLERGASSSAGDFWAEQAKVGLIRLDILEQKPGGMENANRFLKTPKLADETRNALEDVCHTLWSRGDFDRYIAIQKLIMESCSEQNPVYWRARARVAEGEEWLLHPETSARELRIVHESSMAPKDVRMQALRELGYVYLMLGKLEESRNCYREHVENQRDPGKLADGDIYGAFALRGEGKLREALGILDDVARRPGIPHRAAWAALESLLILCALGEGEKARISLDEARKIYPWLSYFQPGYVSLYAYVPEFVAGNFPRASELLLADSRKQNNLIFMHGLQAMIAGFLMEIANDRKGARRIWAEVLRRFPAQRTPLFAPLAEELLKGKILDLGVLPLGNQWVSELNYLAALACESKGDHARCRILLEQCVQLDGSLRWPAFLSKQKLNREGNCPP